MSSLGDRSTLPALRLGLAALALVLLSGCLSLGSDEGSGEGSGEGTGTSRGSSADGGGSDDDPAGTATEGTVVESADGAFTVELPADWERVDVGGADVSLAAQGPVSTDQVVASSFEQPGGAEEQALFLAVGLTKQTGQECERTELEGALVFDCPFDEKGTRYRKLLFPVEAEGQAEGGSVLLLVQTEAASLEEAAQLAGPVVDSLDWA